MCRRKAFSYPAGWACLPTYGHTREQRLRRPRRRTARSAVPIRQVAAGSLVRRTVARRVRHQTLTNCASGQLSSILGVQLLDDVLEVELDRVLADAKLGRDLAVSLADGHKLEDLQLAIGQTLARLRTGPRRAQELVDDSRGSGRRDGGLATSNAFEHRAQLRRFEVLEQVALGAGLDGAEEVGLILADRQHDDGNQIGRASCRERV